MIMFFDFQSLKLKEDIRQLQRQIAEETEKTTSKRGTARGRVDVVIVSDIGKTVELKLTYSMQPPSSLMFNIINTLLSSRKQCNLDSYI